MQRCRAEPLIAFDVPLRRKFQVAQPAILERLNKTFNKDRSFDPRAKPFGNNIRNLASLPVGDRHVS
jgi:hypothetical protein